MSSNILCTGWVTKRGAVKKNWKRRYFVLRSDFTLSYYKDGWSPNSKPQVGGVCELIAGRHSGRAVHDVFSWHDVLGSRLARDIQRGHAVPAGHNRADILFILRHTRGSRRVDHQDPRAEPDGSARAARAREGRPSRDGCDVQVLEVSADEQTALNERVKALARMESNKYCFDCGVKGTRAGCGLTRRRAAVGVVEPRGVSVHALRRHPQKSRRARVQGCVACGVACGGALRVVRGCVSGCLHAHTIELFSRLYGLFVGGGVRVHVRVACNGTAVHT